MTTHIPLTFRTTIEKSPAKGGWTFLVWPGSAAAFGTRGLVKVLGTMDGHTFKSAFMPLGTGQHKLPGTAEMRNALGKTTGDVVGVEIVERVNSPHAS